MPFTDETLKTKITEYVQNDETSFVDNLDTFIIQCEDRISKSVILPMNRYSDTVTLTSGVITANLPEDFLAPFELRIVSGSTTTPVDYVDVSLIREAFPNPEMVGVPRWYSMYDSTSIILGPTPTTDLTGTLNYFRKPPSITTAGTSWLGTNAENCLLYGCLVEAYIYLKGEAGLLKEYNDKFNEALDKLIVLGEGMDLGDAFRMGERRVGKTSP